DGATAAVAADFTGVSGLGVGGAAAITSDRTGSSCIGAPPRRARSRGRIHNKATPTRNAITARIAAAVKDRVTGSQNDGGVEVMRYRLWATETPAWSATGRLLSPTLSNMMSPDLLLCFNSRRPAGIRAECSAMRTAVSWKSIVA